VDSIHRYGTFAAETKAGAYEDSVTEEVAHVTVTKRDGRVGQTTPAAVPDCPPFAPSYRGIIPSDRVRPGRTVSRIWRLCP
jgi:hypothetical protein